MASNLKSDLKAGDHSIRSEGEVGPGAVPVVSADPKHTPGPWLAIRERIISEARPRDGSHDVATASCVGKTNAEANANARLIAAAPDLDAAAGLAITALAFAEEAYANAGNALALAQTAAAKRALIAAQDKARGRERPMVDVTPKNLQRVA